MMSKISLATSIMFEEIKERLEQIQAKLDNSKIENVRTNNLDEALTKIHSEIENSTKRIEAIVEQKEENKVVNHIHSIELKSTKVCVALVVLTLGLLVSLFFNFR